MFRHSTLHHILLLTLLLAGWLVSYGGSPFGRELLAEIAIFVILAISLDLLAGFGAMVSLCHAAFFGFGAYSYAMLTTAVGWPPALALGAAVLLSASAGLLIGLLIARLNGLFFLMTTLAIGEMLHIFTFQSQWLGGDDGIFGLPRLDGSWLGLDLSHSGIFAAVLVTAAGLVYLLLWRLLSAGFGRALIGIRCNSARMEDLGLSIRGHKALAFAIAAACAGFAGTLAAQHTLFVSPEMMTWVTSGEILLLVILGGLGSLIGPALGAIAIILLKHGLAAYTNYWHFFLGVLLILSLLSGRKGLFGWLQRDA